MAKMAKNGIAATETKMPSPAPRQSGRPSSLLDTRVIYCGDNLEQLAKLQDDGNPRMWMLQEKTL